MLNRQKNQKSINNQTSKINNKTNNPKSSRINKLSENKKEKNEKKDFLKPTTKKENIINVKKEMKIKNSKSIIKQTLKPKTNNKKNNNNNQNIYSSNFILPTNDTEIKEEEKIKKTFYETENSKNEEMNLYYLGNLFRTSNLKRTIIIDGNGNNNLNMNKNILNLDNKENNIKRSSLPLKNYEPFSHKKLESECLINKFENKNKLIDEKDELRLKEYGIIFNLINDNIEEMKNMFKKNSQRENSKIEKKIEIKKEQNNIKNNNIIFSEKEKEEINKIGKKNEVSSYIIKGKSFLDSSFQDDFYISFTNNQNNDNVNNNNNYSFEFSSIISNNNSINDKTRNIFYNNINEDLEKTECEIDNFDNENYINQLKNNTFNPRFLLGKKDKKANVFSKNGKDKCIIY